MKIERALRCMTEGESNSDRLIGPQTAGKDRVGWSRGGYRSRGRRTRTPSKPGWSYEPTKRVLEQLIDDAILCRDEIHVPPRITLSRQTIAQTLS